MATSRQNKVVLIVTIALMHVWWFSTTSAKTANPFTGACIYVPANRRFQRYNTIDANTVTARTGPTIKYHSTVILSRDKKKKNTTRYLVTMI